MEVGDVIGIKLGNEDYPATIISKDNANNTYTVYVEKVNKKYYINSLGQIKEE